MSLRALIVDNGSWYTGLIGQLVREAAWQTATVSAASLGSAGPTDHLDAVILTGTDLPAFAPGYEAEIRLIRSAADPILVICGGMQLVGRAFGVGLDKGPRVIGRTVVRLARGVELFEEMPAEVSLFQRHIYRLTAAPPDSRRSPVRPAVRSRALATPAARSTACRGIWNSGPKGDGSCAGSYGWRSAGW